ncbi:hypothetical protein Agub_g268 [Astrephomene gubernaculifera]|uniref:Class IV aminotransferase n=1 Tax=Astrephomene gubernaculifera TaxID=47775 RepID=A0AAD3HGH7_9CHLO|nr:hypothetical protein Agub_g268 [Astrephomene gubernaculifera]
MDTTVVYLENGCIHPDCTLTPQQVLLKHAGGVYTTALFTPDGCVVDWDLHRQRLLRGIEVLNTRPSQPFQPLLSTLQAQGSSLSAFLEQAVVPRVREALGAFFGGRIGSGPGSSCPAGSSPDAHHQQQQQQQGQGQEQDKDQEQQLLQQQQQQHAMFVVIISPTGTGKAAVVADASATVTGGTEVGLATAAATEGPQQGAVGGAQELPVSVAVYCKSVQLQPYGSQHAIQAAVLGAPRPLPVAKAASWVAERRSYEERRPAEAAEVLLSDSEGRILEGLTTNFFVIMTAPGAAEPTVATTASTTRHAATEDDEGGRTSNSQAQSGDAACESASSVTAPASQATLRGCGTDSAVALPGTAAARVVEAARRLGLRVELEPPRAAERAQWSEAFVCNSVRGILPLSRVFCPQDNAWGADPWDCPLPHAAGPHTSALLAEMRRLQTLTPWNQL